MRLNWCFLLTTSTTLLAYFYSLSEYKVDSASDVHHILDACIFTYLVNGMFQEKSASLLLGAHDTNGGAVAHVRKSFMKDVFTVFNSYGVNYWLEGGALIQAVRNITAIPNEPAYLPFDDIDIGIRDTEMIKKGPLVSAMHKLNVKGFKVIRCNRAAFSVERGGEYMDVMIFSSHLPSCAVREPNAVDGCSSGLAKYIMNTHKQKWVFLDHISVPLPGKSLLETADYLEGMFGSSWQQHDSEDWRSGGNRGKNRGKSADWSVADARLTSKTERFTLDPFGKVYRVNHTLQSVMVDGNYMVRLGDYPSTSNVPIHVQRQWLADVVSVFENYDIPYLLTVSPHRLYSCGELQAHVTFLNAHVKSGFICMHGLFYSPKHYSRDVCTEENDYSTHFARKSNLNLLWKRGNEILLKLNRYTSEHFVQAHHPLTSDTVDVLYQNGVRFIHITDLFMNRKLKSFASPRIVRHKEYVCVAVVISEWGKTHAGIDTVVAYANSTIHPSQISLNWVLDHNKPEWRRSYELLSQVLQLRKSQFR